MRWEVWMSADCDGWKADPIDAREAGTALDIAEDMWRSTIAHTDYDLPNGGTIDGYVEVDNSHECVRRDLSHDIPCDEQTQARAAVLAAGYHPSELICSGDHNFYSDGFRGTMGLQDGRMSFHSTCECGLKRTEIRSSPNRMPGEPRRTVTFDMDTIA